ncbi:MAG: NADPH-dependent oxidoreductase [Gammaproteobacteria bacterium]|nr:NADPH-dependent oxidoreductase [Gammaproteobacteria bacterium]
MSEQSFAALYAARFGEPLSEALDGPVEQGVANILRRRTVRQLESTPIAAPLMSQLLACAQSAPTKSDLQQYSIVVIENSTTRATIAEWIGTMAFIVESGAFLVFCGDIRRNRKLAEVHGHPHVNDNLDSFFNATVDGALAMQSFILAAAAAGLATVPVSYIRNYAARVADLLKLPQGVFPIAGLALGYPKWQGKVSMRLPPQVVVHRECYDDTGLQAAVQAYGDRRHAREPIVPAKQRHTQRYGALDKCVWSEQVTRQLSVPERPDFRAFIKAQGFSLK